MHALQKLILVLVIINVFIRTCAIILPAIILAEFCSHLDSRSDSLAHIGFSYTSTSK